MIELEARPREVFGKKLRTLREKGEMPGVLYGPGEKSISLSLDLKDFKKIWKQAGESSLIELKIGSKKKNVLIHDVALEPVKDQPLHADFYVVKMDKPIAASVPLVFKGVSEAVKSLGGVLVKVMHEIEVEALPLKLPHEIEADISKLRTFEDQILIKDLALPEGVKTTFSLEEVVASIENPEAREQKEEAEEKEIDLEKVEVAGEKKPEQAPAEKEQEEKEENKEQQESGKDSQ